MRGLLTAERTALNLVCHLSGVATATRAWVDAVAGTGARIRDTRKTLPGLRLLEKYAVRCGGGVNHRLGLGDAVLIKDNHVAAAGSVGAALAAARRHAPSLPCEVEVDTLDQLDEVLALGAELVLLDNFTVADTAEAVRRRGSARTGLESSGGLAPGERPRLRRDRRRLPRRRRAHPLRRGARPGAGPALTDCACSVYDRGPAATHGRVGPPMGPVAVAVAMAALVMGAPSTWVLCGSCPASWSTPCSRWPSSGSSANARRSPIPTTAPGAAS